MAENDDKVSDLVDAADEKEAQSKEIAHKHAALETVYTEDTIDARYLAKAQILNEAMQEIGMGRYQWCVPLTRRIVPQPDALDCTPQGPLLRDWVWVVRVQLSQSLLTHGACHLIYFLSVEITCGPCVVIISVGSHINNPLFFAVADRNRPHLTTYRQ